MLAQFRQAGKVALALLIAAGFMSGCGNLDHSPMMSNDGQTEPALDQAPSYMVFSPRVFRSGKVVTPDGAGKVKFKEEKKFKKRRGGTIEVKFDYTEPKAEGAVRLTKAKFRVWGSGLSKDATISMTAYSGDTLEDIVVAFTPAGLKFRVPAILELELEGGNFRSGRMTGYHIEDDGTITEIDIWLIPRRNGWKLWMKVPGFSRYSIDDI